ncbi:MAG: extracellular solute-binding protein [Bacillota bacterium]|nr:extracellular solute-binding protein [Bacillota bacterium]
MNKKFLRVLGILLIIGMFLSACGGTAATTTAPASKEATEEAEKTTAAPEKTTAAPEETSAAPEETTAAPEETTAAPEETEAAETDAGGSALLPNARKLFDEPTTFSILAHTTPPSGPDAWTTPNEMPFYAALQEATNVVIEWETIPWGNWVERMNILMTGGDYPDAFLKGNIQATDLINYGSQGRFVNLQPLLKEHAPRFYELMTERDIEDFLVLGDGIYGMPTIFDSDGVRIGKTFVNENWLENVGLEPPTTLDEFTDMLRAFKAEDANGNGDPDDEFPIGSTSVSGLYSHIYSLWDLGNRGTSPGQFDIDPDTGKVRYWRISEPMKEVLKTIKTWYDEELFDHNIFTSDAGSIFYNNILEDKYGVHNFWASVSGPDLVNVFQPLPAPLKGDMGQHQNNVSGTFGSRGAFVITDRCATPEKLLSWVDYFYTEEGAVGYYLGLEGTAYTKTADGKYELTEHITHNEDGLNQENALLLYAIGSGGQNPAWLTDDTFKGGETYPTSLKGSEINKPFIPDIIWNNLPMTEAQADTVREIQTEINTVITEFEAKFVTGELDIDADWQSYQDTLASAGVDRLIAVYQEIIDEKGFE